MDVMNPGELPESTQNPVEPEQLPEDWLQPPLQPPPLPAPAVSTTKSTQMRYESIAVDPLWPRAFFANLHPSPFALPDSLELEEKLVWLQERLQLQPGARVLDYNCGHGLYAQGLAEQGFWIIGTDVSSDLLAEANKRSVGKPGLPLYVQTDLRSGAFAECFDGAYCLDHRFGFLNEQEALQALQNIARSLRPHGMLVLHVPNRDAVVADTPAKRWWGDSTLAVHEDVWVHDISSRIQIKQEIFFAGGRQTQRHYSVRVYSAHELHTLLSSLGFDILEISGSFFAKRAFFGVDSSDIVIVAQKQAS